MGWKVCWMPSSTILAINSPQWQDIAQTREDSVYKNWFHIKSSLSPQENLWNSRDLSYHALPLRAICPKLNTVNQRWRTISWRLRLAGLKEFVDGGDWTWPIKKSTINSGEISNRRSWPEADLYLGEIWHIRPNLGLMIRVPMHWTILSERVSSYFLRGHRRNASLEVLIAGVLQATDLWGDVQPS